MGSTVPGAHRADVQILRLGENWAQADRFPKYDPSHPLTGGWLTAATPPNFKGRFGQAVAGIHTAGDWLEWEAEAQASGSYGLWFLYGAVNEPYGSNTMSGRCQVQVDGGPAVMLEGLEDTADWTPTRWSRVAILQLSAGRHRIRWTNVKGGGLNLDAWRYAMIQHGTRRENWRTNRPRGCIEW